MAESQTLEKYAITQKAEQILFCEFEPGSTLFFLQEGNVRLVKIINDKEKTLAIIRPGDIFGEMSILEKRPRSATAIAETDVKLLELDKESFLTLIKSQPAIGIKLLKIFAARIIDQKRKLTIIHREDNRTKVLDTLLMVYEKGNLRYDADNAPMLKITAKEIGSWAGISEAESAKTIDALMANNYIEHDAKNNLITLKNIDIIRSFIERKK